MPRWTSHEAALGAVHRPYEQDAAVGRQLNRAVFVSPQQRHLPSLQSRDDTRCGVPEAIRTRHRSDGERWSQRLEHVLARGGRAAVMGQAQHRQRRCIDAR